MSRGFWWWVDIVSMVVFAVVGFWGVVYAVVADSESAAALGLAALAMSKASEAMVWLRDGRDPLSTNQESSR